MTEDVHTALGRIEATLEVIKAKLDYRDGSAKIVSPDASSEAMEKYQKAWAEQRDRELAAFEADRVKRGRPLEGVDDAFRAMRDKPAGFIKGVILPQT